MLRRWPLGRVLGFRVLGFRVNPLKYLLAMPGLGSLWRVLSDSLQEAFVQPSPGESGVWKKLLQVSPRSSSEIVRSVHGFRVKGSF